VMYLGKIVETAPKKSLFDDPKHPYTQALLSAIPVPNPNLRKKGRILMGDVPSPINPPSGCRFHPRCSERMKICDREQPKIIEVSPGHFVSCWLYD